MTPLNNKIHATLKVQKSADVSRFKSQQLIPVTVQDFIPLSTEFPIIFIKNEETGQFTSVAMMGLRPGINLYCQEAHWPCPVMPIGFHNAPFSLAKNPKDEHELIVCIDEKSPLVNTNNGDALFDNSGQQTEFLKQRSQQVLSVAEHVEQTQSIVNFFAQNKLLTSKKLTIKLENEQEPITLNGIYLIDEMALNALPSKQFEELRTKGLLPLIYAHLTSLHQLSRLTIKQNEFERK